MLLDGQYNIQQQYLDKTKGNGYEGMTPEQEAYWRQDNMNDIKQGFQEGARDAFIGTAEGLLSAPVGMAEAVVGLPMDVYGAAKGLNAAYDAEDGKGMDAFLQEYDDTPMTTQWIQERTNEYLPEWMQGDSAGSWGRLGGEFLAPGGYFKALKRLGLGSKELTGASLLGGGTAIE